MPRSALLRSAVVLLVVCWPASGRFTERDALPTAVMSDIGRLRANGGASRRGGKDGTAGMFSRWAGRRDARHWQSPGAQSEALRLLPPAWRVEGRPDHSRYYSRDRDLSSRRRFGSSSATVAGGQMGHPNPDRRLRTSGVRRRAQRPRAWRGWTGISDKGDRRKRQSRQRLGGSPGYLRWRQDQLLRGGETGYVSSFYQSSDTAPQPPTDPSPSGLVILSSGTKEQLNNPDQHSAPLDEPQLQAGHTWTSEGTITDSGQSVEHKLSFRPSYHPEELQPVPARLFASGDIAGQWHHLMVTPDSAPDLSEDTFPPSPLTNVPLEYPQPPEFSQLFSELAAELPPFPAASPARPDSPAALPAGSHSPEEFPAGFHSQAEVPAGSHSPTESPVGPHSPTEFPAGPHLPFGFPAGAHLQTEFSDGFHSQTAFPQQPVMEPAETPVGRLSQLYREDAVSQAAATGLSPREPLERSDTLEPQWHGDPVQFQQHVSSQPQGYGPPKNPAKPPGRRGSGPRRYAAVIAVYRSELPGVRRSEEPPVPAQ